METIAPVRLVHAPQALPLCTFTLSVDLLLITAQATTLVEAAAHDGFPIPVAVLTAVKALHDADAEVAVIRHAHTIRQQNKILFIQKILLVDRMSPDPGCHFGEGEMLARTALGETVDELFFSRNQLARIPG